jgi:hypothetical protein
LLNKNGNRSRNTPKYEGNCKDPLILEFFVSCHSMI